MVEMISRQAAVDMLMERASTLRGSVGDLGGACSGAAKLIMQMPSAEPQIIYCKDCRKHNKRIGDYVEKSDGTYDWIWKDQACPLAEFREKAQGHEFDYQYCAYGERRTE